MKLADLFVKIGFDADTAKVKDFARAVGEIPLEVAGAIGAMAGLEFGAQKLFGEAMNVAVGFEAFTNQTGLSARELQRWQIVAAQANVSAETMTSSVSGLQKQLAEISLGRGNQQPFLMAGINPHTDAFGVLRQLRRRVPGMDRATATNLIGQMGLSPDMMNVLLLSERKFEEFGRRVRGMSAQDQEAFLQSKLALQQLGLEFKDFSFRHLAPLAEEFAKLVESLHGMKETLPAIIGIAGALGVAFAPMTTAIAALLALLDDLVAYKQGRDSLIGTIMGKNDVMKKWGQKLDKENDDIVHMRGKYAPGPDIAFKDSIVGKAVYSLFDKMTGGGDTNVDIRVDGSGSPGETAEAVHDHIKRHLNRTGGQTAGKQDRR